MPAAADLLLDPPVHREMAAVRGAVGATKGAVGATKEAVAKYHSQPDRQRHQAFIQEAVNVMLDEAVFSLDRQSPVLRWTDPDKLLDILDLDLDKSPLTHDRLLGLVKDTIKYSVKTGHPYFMNQLFSGVDPYGLVGQWLTDALNPSVYTYEVSPVFTLMEEKVLAEMRRIVGWTQGDGIFCPGGSMANGYAISCARYHALPQVKSQGLHGLPRLVVYTSEDAHYSIKKLATLQGLGSDNVYLIRTDSRGRMDVNDLRAQIQRTIQEGAKPFMVSATAGTTVLGAFDPLPEIADVCEANGLWLHVDAAWGGGALMSPRHRHLLNGIHRADSVTWNPHKLLTAPQQCSTFLTRHTDLLGPCHSACATYLFQQDKFYDTRYDTGDKHVQCGRRADVLKFWFMWKAKGTDGLAAHIDTVFDNAAFFTEQIRHRPGFKLVLDQPECTNVTFWYIPPSLRSQENQPDYNQRLHKVAPKIKERMMREGTMMITYQPLKDLPNFFRLVIQNSGLDHADMSFVIQEIERLGADL
ncbi:cysteine sulfinic acid decarboxylase-like [Macrosteles quadrilineatus]|uniref:cysteine sulfinic acid decarboxylase-like n=1 Tax=Macrosteles quadrilineatus TaxID=74068 RepID=UPI0023E328B3|nr:cysteine sulfinic acid decarboxylase-like [Macrosteles quadrilineatus]